MRKRKTQLVVDRILRALDGFSEDKQRKVLVIVENYIGDDQDDDEDDDDEDDDAPDFLASDDERSEREAD